MNSLLIAVLVAFLAGADGANKLSAPKQKVGAAQPSAAVDAEYEKIVEKDEAALEQIEKLVKEFDQFAEKGAAGSRGALLVKIDQVIDGVKKSYESFLEGNPKHVDGRLAYGSFLNEIGEENAALEQWEKARTLDPKNPSPWNNMANIFGHRGPVKKAFQYYEKAIELDSKEPVYLQNLATTVYLYRKDAVETYRIDEEQVFNKSLDLYRQAMMLDPTNLVLATEYAQSYYGIKPLRAEEALAAWNQCLSIAKNDVEKQGVYLHLARVAWMAGKLDEAQKHLDKVNLPDMQELKSRVQRNITKKRTEPAETKSDEEVELTKKE